MNTPGICLIQSSLLNRTGGHDNMPLYCSNPGALHVDKGPIATLWWLVPVAFSDRVVDLLVDVTEQTVTINATGGSYLSEVQDITALANLSAADIITVRLTDSEADEFAVLALAHYFRQLNTAPDLPTEQQQMQPGFLWQPMFFGTEQSLKCLQTLRERFPARRVSVRLAP